MRVTILCWVVAFFVVIVPGHRRGVIELPGHQTDSDSAVYAGFCPLCVMIPVGNSGDPPPADAPVNCAICFLKANLDTPPQVVLPPVFFEQMDYLLNSPVSVTVISVAPQFWIRGRAPPTTSLTHCA